MAKLCIPATDRLDCHEQRSAARNGAHRLRRLLGTEDQLSRLFFTEIPFLIYPNVVPGGQPSDFLMLEAERIFPPTRENPEPVVRTAYERASAPKMLLSRISSS